MIFQKSLEEDELSQEWEPALISSVHKAGSKLESENFRPSSLTCILCKVMEKFIKRYNEVSGAEGHIMCCPAWLSTLLRMSYKWSLLAVKMDKSHSPRPSSWLFSLYC
uniref:Uncharacterized protein n=1 Tax=Schistocephalus solidus TaxID=70667 RepID=A0A0V0J8Z3_SCHSO